MAKVNVQDKLISITTEDQFDQLVNQTSESQLIIIDCHEDWCGPCMAIIPFYNALWLELDDPDKRIVPCTLDRSSAKFNKKLQSLLGSELKLDAQGCRPLFICIKNKQAVGTVNGCNTPTLRMYIDLHIPKIVKKE